MKKTAQDPSSIISNAFESVYDPEDKAGSLSKFVGPALVSKLMQAMGFGFYGTLVGVLMSTFDIDIAGILKGVVSQLAPQITAGQEFTPEEVKSKVESAFDAGFGASKAASLDFNQIIKTAGPRDKGLFSGIGESFSKFFESDDFKHKWGNNLSSGTKPVLVRVFSAIFTIALSSMGLMAAGQVGKKILGKPNAIDGTQEQHQSKTHSKPLKYKTKPGVSQAVKSMWMVPYKNTDQDIQRFLIKCVRNSFEVDQLSDNEISRAPVFSDIRDDISIYNDRMKSEKGLLIPADYKNELTIAYPIVKELS